MVAGRSQIGGGATANATDIATGATTSGCKGEFAGQFVKWTAASKVRVQTPVKTSCAFGGQAANVAKLKSLGVEGAYDFTGLVLQQGDQGDAVKALQEFLASQGFFKSADGCTGYFGQQTRLALMNWQAKNGLPQTGVMGTLSLEVYNAIMEEQLQRITKLEQAALKAAAQRSAATATATKKAAVAAPATTPTPAPKSSPAAQPSLSLPTLGKQALQNLTLRPGALGASRPLAMPLPQGSMAAAMGMAALAGASAMVIGMMLYRQALLRKQRSTKTTAELESDRELQRERWKKTLLDDRVGGPAPDSSEELGEPFVPEDGAPWEKSVLTAKRDVSDSLSKGSAAEN
eukprot:jgi/Mesvir1/924/Mv17483-RA.1